MSPSQEERDLMQPPPRTDAEIAAETAELARVQALASKVKELERSTSPATPDPKPAFIENTTQCGKCGLEYVIPAEGPAVHTCIDGTTLPANRAASGNFRPAPTAPTPDASDHQGKGADVAAVATDANADRGVSELATESSATVTDGALSDDGDLPTGAAGRLSAAALPTGVVSMAHDRHGEGSTSLSSALTSDRETALGSSLPETETLDATKLVALLNDLAAFDYFADGPERQQADDLRALASRLPGLLQAEARVKATQDALDEIGIGGIYDEFRDPADAISQLHQYGREQESQRNFEDGVLREKIAQLEAQLSRAESDREAATKRTETLEWELKVRDSRDSYDSEQASKLTEYLSRNYPMQAGRGSGDVTVELLTSLRAQLEAATRTIKAHGTGHSDGCADEENCTCGATVLRAVLDLLSEPAPVPSVQTKP